MATTESSVASLRQPIGRRRVSPAVVPPGPANLRRLELGRAAPALEVGDPLPPGWHHLYFLPRFGPEELRPDGSPRDTGVVPPMPLPRRMFAGQHTRFHRPIRIGDSIRRETELTDITPKAGGTGTLVFTTVVDRILSPEGLALEEERRGVFREEGKAGAQNAVPRREDAPTGAARRPPIVPAPELLFRFSAVTFHSRRIHYDRALALAGEGY